MPSTQECGLWKLANPDPKYVAGQAYTGGPLPTRQNATGEVTAIDMATGKVAWAKPMPYAGQGGTVVTSTGLTFTSDLGGDIYAMETKSGRVLWKTATGASIIAPISVYGSGGDEYVAVLSGSAGSQQTPNAPAATSSILTAYRLGPIDSPISNGTAGQTAVADTGSSANAPASVGSAPYTPAQVSAGVKLYQQQCSACHGAQLQGISAPALGGASFGKAHMTLTQLRSVVTTQMPLTAPGGLKPDQYASIMAFMLKQDCVAPAGGGTQPFPTTNQPSFAKVIIGGRSCPSK